MRTPTPSPSCSPNAGHGWLLAALALLGVGCSDDGQELPAPYVPPSSPIVPVDQWPPSVGPASSPSPDPGERPPALDAWTTPGPDASAEDPPDDPHLDAAPGDEDAEAGEEGAGPMPTCPEVPCPPGTVCDAGQCAPVICEPGTRWCESPELVGICAPTGTLVAKSTCNKGFFCEQGVCQPPEPNFLILFDTSGTMAIAPPGTTLAPWPVCDAADVPATRLGVAKAAFSATLADLELDSPRRFALLRFAQRNRWVKTPNCTFNYYEPTPKARVVGDDDTHALPLDEWTWFDENLDQVVAHPFEAGPGSGVEGLLRWIDFSEEIETLEGVSCAACPGFCDNGCHVHVDPELRTGGSTPLGRHLYYAGEYLRRQVLLEGKPCAGDADCASPHYTCQGGACHDPHAGCRRTEILLFTDGFENVVSSETDYYHPINQAKRMFAGLGCDEDGDCAPGSQCDQGVCRPHGDASLLGTLLATPHAGVCPTTLAPCTLGAFGQCDKGTCTGPWHFYEDAAQGVRALYGWDGSPLRVRTHVIDTSGPLEMEKASLADLSMNPLTALWGGGLYLQVGPLDGAAIRAAIEAIAITKAEGSCAP